MSLSLDDERTNLLLRLVQLRFDDFDFDTWSSAEEALANNEYHRAVDIITDELVGEGGNRAAFIDESEKLLAHCSKYLYDLKSRSTDELIDIFESEIRNSLLPNHEDWLLCARWSYKEFALLAIDVDPRKYKILERPYKELFKSSIKNNRTYGFIRQSGEIGDLDIESTATYYINWAISRSIRLSSEFLNFQANINRENDSSELIASLQATINKLQKELAVIKKSSHPRRVNNIYRMMIGMYYAAYGLSNIDSKSISEVMGDLDKCGDVLGDSSFSLSDETVRSVLHAACQELEVRTDLSSYNAS